MNQQTQRWAPLMAALVAAGALGACSPRNDGQTVGQKVDETVAKVEQKTDAARAQAGTEATQAKEAMKEAGRDIKESTGDAATKVATAVSDASITTAVNAELAKDDKLSAMKINVDTSSGRVELNGTAPDPAAKERASRLAGGVKGVTGVENRLTVAP